MTEITKDTILAALRAVKDPDLHRDIVSLDFVKDLEIDGPDVRFRLVLTTPACPVKEKLEQEAREAVQSIPGVRRINVRLEAEVPTGRGVGGKQSVPGIRNIIAVSSGKGGVGKSTVAVNLAAALARTGARVGLLDTDVYGPNVPIMVGVDEEPVTRGKKLVPLQVYGMKVMSIGL